MADPRPSRRRYEIALWIDRRVGPLVCAVLLGVKRLLARRRQQPPREAVRRILLLKMWGMGSIVLASPLLARLRELYPGARIDFATLEENRAVLGLYPGVDRVISIDMARGVPRFLLQTLRVISRLRRERYDLLLDLEFFTRFSAVFSFLSGPAWSHGFSAKGNWRGRLHDLEVPFNAYAHVTQNFVTLLSGDYMEPVDATAADGPAVLPRLEAPDAAWERCRARLAEDPAWRGDLPLVVVNPNAGDMALERRWPRERVGELLRLLCARGDLDVVLVGSPDERAYVDEVAHGSGVAEQLVNLAGRSSLPELVALLARAAVVVTNDSGPMHLAAAAGASTVALFGPETPTLYRPLRCAPQQRHAVHYLGLGCSPCMFVHDNKVLSCWFSQARCMLGIESSEVMRSVEAILAAAAAPQRRRADA